MKLKKIVSFGFKYEPPAHEPGVLILDVQKMFANPFSQTDLRGLDGRNPAVQEWIVNHTSQCSQKLALLETQAQEPGLEIVYVGCRGGRHRSVYVAEYLGKWLGVPVEHRDVEREK